MSDTDSFIDEVNDEVRRDRLFRLLKRYGWIAIVLIVLIVGSAAWSEYRKAQERARAEALGDAMLAALSADSSADRAEALVAIEPGVPSSAAVLEFMTAAELAEAGEQDAAVTTLDRLAVNNDVPMIYRQIAQLKSITLQGETTPVSDRRQALEAMAQAGNPLRLLAAEQLALIEIAHGTPEDAIAQYQAILVDAEATSDLQQRALQVIVALGGEPKMDGIAGLTEEAAPTDGN